MYRNHKIALVIPAHNEERLIRPTLESSPELFDNIYVVDDASTDGMAAVVESIGAADPRVHLLSHPTNLGPGQGIITGYLKSNQDDHDITVVCGGDHQMPLHETPKLLDAVIDNDVDYAKGNRFMERGNAFDIMPNTRFWGNTLLSLMTKVASGNYDVFDVVDGFTAISKRGIERVDWSKAWKGYGYPMDFVIRISAAGLTIKDIPRTAIYTPGERQSQIKGFQYMIKVTPMIGRAFLNRLLYRYVFADFHPLVFFYGFGALTLLMGSIGGGILMLNKLFYDGMMVTGPRSIVVAMLMLAGGFSILSAMGMDLQNFQYEKLKKSLSQVQADQGKQKKLSA